jgi:hypothetical protein
MSSAVMNAPKSTSAASSRQTREAMQCQLKFEKYKGGLRIRCRCNEAADCADFQNLCQSVCNGTLICCCTQDDLQVCKFDFSNADCKCENMKDGCCITCTSGDAKCAKTLQACCECLETCCKNDGCCTVYFGNTCCCCGTCPA